VGIGDDGVVNVRSLFSDDCMRMGGRRLSTGVHVYILNDVQVWWRGSTSYVDTHRSAKLNLPTFLVEAVRQMLDRIRHWACNVSYKPVPANVRDMSSGDEPIAVHRGCVTVQSVTVTATLTTKARSRRVVRRAHAIDDLKRLLGRRADLQWRL
jgi:hypothetical protein